MRLILIFNSLLLAAVASSWAAAPADDALFAQARLSLKQADYQQAAAQLDAIDKQKLTPLDRFHLGWLYGQAHQFSTALQIFRALPSGVPDPMIHAYAVALCESQMSHYPAAVTILTPFARQDNASSNVLNLLGVSQLKTGSPDQAFATFQFAIERYPANPTAYFNSVTLLCENGRFKECAVAARKTANIFSQMPEAHIIYGAAQLENGRLPEGREEFAAARRLAPRSPEAAFFQALVSFRTGEFQAAVGVLRSAIQDGANDCDVHTLLAESLLRQSPENAADAIAELDQAVILNPDSVAALTSRGKLYLARKDYAHALTDLERAIEHDANSRPAIYALARAYQLSGNATRARELRSRLVRGSEDVMTNLAEDRLRTTLQGPTEEEAARK